MPDLETVVADTLQQLATLASKSDQCDADISAAHAAATDMTHRVEVQSKILVPRAQELVDKITRGRDTITDRAPHATQQVSQLATEVDALQPRVRDQFQQLIAALTDLSAYIDQFSAKIKDARAANDKAMADLTARADQALKDLAHVVVQSQQAVTDFTVKVADNQAVIQDRDDRLVKQVRDVALPAIVARVEEFDKRVKAATAQLTSTLSEAGQSCRQAATDALARLDQQEKQSCQDPVAQAALVVKALQDTTQDIRSRSGECKDAKDQLIPTEQDACKNLKVLAQIPVDLQQVLRKHGIKC